MDDVVAALGAQQDVMVGLLAGLSEDDWQRPSRCEGWSIADVVVHLYQTNEMAVASASGRLAEAASELGWTGGNGTVDDLAEQAVVKERGRSGPELLARYQQSAADQLAALRARGPSDRVPWVMRPLSVRTLATTRLSETWIHTGDVAPVDQATDDVTAPGALPLIARLAWRTLPYAFERAGRTIAGPVAVTLDDLVLTPDEPAVTTVEGPLLDWCEVAARRVDPADTELRATGPDADAVLELVRTYA